MRQCRQSSVLGTSPQIASGRWGRMQYERWQGYGHPNKSIIGLPVVKEREMLLASCGSLMGMSRAW